MYWVLVTFINQHESNMFAPRNVLSKKLKGDHYRTVKDLLSFVQDHFKRYICVLISKIYHIMNMER